MGGVNAACPDDRAMLTMSIPRMPPIPRQPAVTGADGSAVVAGTAARGLPVPRLATLGSGKPEGLERSASPSSETNLATGGEYGSNVRV